MERGRHIAYLPVEEIARGGMGHVDLVLRRDASFERLYAMKRLSPALRDDEAFRRMFVDEARVAGLLRHPNVVSVLDVGEDEQGPFLVMDFVDGLPLSELQRGFGASGEMLPVQVCLRIAQQIAEGLHAAHELCAHDGSPLHLVHRDVSPQNVLVGFDGVVRLTDFGVAKALGRQSATTVDVLKGKVAYMSPEQLRFEEIDRRSDLFSLGVIFFELLANERLYYDRDVSKSARRVLQDAPPDIGRARADVSDPVVELLFDLLCKDREHRPRTARDVSERIEAIIHDHAGFEESLSLAAFIEERFSERRSAEKERRAGAVLEAKDRGSRSASAARRRRLLLAAAGVLALGGSAALGAWAAGAFTNDSAREPRVELAATPPTEPAPASEDQPPGEELEDDLPEGEEVREEPARERPRARKRPRRRAAMIAETETETARDGRLWSWE